MDGHEEHIPRRDVVESWISEISKGRTKYWYLTSTEDSYKKLIKCLANIDWSFDNNGIIKIKFRNQWIVSDASEIRMPSSKLFEYKQICWRKGILYHEDVLYFSYLILMRSPRVIEFIRARFPYIFIDEFQDTTEVQTWLIEKITEENTKVGVVGDTAQSIYKFAGAKCDDFINLKRDIITEYKLKYNHRSTKNIVNFLNLLRPDINQEYEEDQPDGICVQVLVGTIQKAKIWYKRNYPDSILHILTRKNTTVTEINNQLGVDNTNLLKKLYSSDSNQQRVRFIHSLLTSIKFYHKNDLRNALNEIYKPLRRASGVSILKLNIRRLAIEIIDSLKDNINRNKPIAEFYLDLRTEIFNEYNFYIGSNLSRGNAKTFYESHNLNDILPYVKVDTKSDDQVRTIHSAKGAEFDNVLVHFDTVNDFRKYILEGQSHINDTEDDCRIYYVGCSRAKHKLFINVPEINQSDKEKFEAMTVKFEIV